jgi:hypothetical protein
MRWAGHVAGMGRTGTDIGRCWDSRKAVDRQEDQDVGGFIMLK